MGGLTSLLPPLLAALALVTTQGPTLTLPTRAFPGQRVEVNGTGFVGCLVSPSFPSDVRILWGDVDSTDVRARTTTTDGTFKATITVPDVKPDPYEVTAICQPPLTKIQHSATTVDETTPIQVTAAPVTTRPTSTRPTTARTTETRPRTAAPTTDGGWTGVPPVTPETGSNQGAGGGANPTSGGNGVLPIAAIVVLLGLVVLVVSRMRSRTPPPVHTTASQQPAQVPAVRAVGSPGPPGTPSVRQTGPGRSHAIRVVGRTDPGVQVARTSGEGRPR